MKLSKTGVEIEDQDGEKTSITVDGDEGDVTINTGGTVSKIGSNAELPADLPKDILFPENAELVLTSETETDGTKMFMITYHVIGNLSSDAEKYLQYLKNNGYDTETIQLGDSLISHHGRTTSHYLHYQMMNDEEDSYTLTIIYGELE